MKKVFTAIVAMSISAASFAQVSLGVQGIANLSKAKTNTEAALNSTQASLVLPGAGLVAEFSVGENLAIRPAINYLQHGIKVKGEMVGDLPDGASSAQVEGKTVLNYVQIPVNVMYKFPLGKQQFYIGAGAYASYGISGKVKLTVKLDNHEIEGGTMKEDPFEKGEADEGLKRSDFGINGLAGIRFNNGVFANLGYQLGLSNSSRDADGQFKNRGLQLTLGYFFWNK